MASVEINTIGPHRATGLLAVVADDGTLYLTDGQSAWPVSDSDATAAAQTAADGAQTDADAAQADIDATQADLLARRTPIAMNAQTTMVANRTYLLTTSGGGFKAIMPATPATGDRIEIIWVAGDMSDNPILVRNNADNATLFTLSVDATAGEFVYTGAAWEYHAKAWA